MKRWRDRGSIEPGADRDAPAIGPLEIEPLATRGRRLRFGVPITIGLVVLITGFAFAGKYIERFNLGGEEVTPAPPTPIAWIDTTVEPGASPSPPVIGPSESQAASETPAPSGSAGASPSAARVRIIRVEATPVSYYWLRTQPNHFTITLTNTSGGPFPLDPCPTYRMYILNPGAPEGPDRLLNCAAIGGFIASGQSVSLDMEFDITASDPGGYQVIAWKLVSPPGYQAFATLTNVFIQESGR
jgi:hypothetical protein